MHGKPSRLRRRFAALAVLAVFASSTVRAAETARGTVFEDRNGNGMRDEGEPGVAGVAVSNQDDVVLTRADGAYELPVTDDCIVFITKPAGYRTPVSRDQLPRFYYIHKPGGSPKLIYPGVEPTGPLPDSVDFPLMNQEEPENFSVVVFADPQPQTGQEVDYVRDDVVSSLVGTVARFGITVGDIMSDDLGLFEYYNRIVAQIGIPFYNVIGNHDMNYDAATDAESDETFHRHFGPNYYSWNYAKVHFIALDTVEWLGAGKGGGNYRGAIGARQLAWLKQDLAHVPDDHLVVLTMHIPIITGDRAIQDASELFQMLKNRHRVLAVAGHTHFQEHIFATRENGWQGSGVFHEVISGTVSGSWWSGPKDERGVPVADCRDGTPNGYTMIDFSGDDYVTSYLPAKGSPDDLMRIYPPGSTGRDERARRLLLVNIFDCSIKCKVEYAFDDGDFRPLERMPTKDPLAVAILESVTGSGKPWATAYECAHMWGLELSEPLPRGTHVVTIRVTDHFNRKYQRSRVFSYR